MKQIERRPLVATLRWRDGDQIDVSVYLDRVAVHKSYLLMASVVGYTSDIKAMRAGLATGLRSAIELRDRDHHKLTLKKGGQDVVPDPVLCLQGVKYLTESYRLGHGVHHAIFVARFDGLMMEASDEALWRELKHPRFSTPLLRGWLPYLRRELEMGGLLRPLACLDCHCAGLSAKTADLDRIVEGGLKNGLITISEEEAA